MIAVGIVTYSINGKQYVAFTSGNVSRLTSANWMIRPYHATLQGA
jgi:hypothetical protein